MQRHLSILFALAAILICHAQPEAEYWISALGNASSGDFAPYMIGSWNHGKNPQKGSALLDAYVGKRIDMSRRFSWGYAVEGITGYTTTNDYALWDSQSDQWTTHSEGPSAAWVQQLYAEIKYRGLFLTVGLKEHESALLNNQLSSGDFIESNNARPIPEARIGFIDFQDVPFTRHWVQIQGEVSYGRMTDDNYLKDHYNYYDYHLHLKSRYTYRRCYFRTNPDKPFSATVGMQVGTFFAGYTRFYNDGKETEIRKCSESIASFFKVLIPFGENGEDYYQGSSVGCWDLRMRYRLKSGNEVFAYFQGPWEDGSSIGRMNKFDGLWGLEWRSAKPGIVTGVVLEYLDFRDQSGPSHWAPDDTPGTSVTSEATGRDDYYNNYLYNSYANYGMSTGTPFLVSPIYNLDGFPGFACNRMNGFHAGAMGNVSSTLKYRLLTSHQRGLGTYRVPYYRVRTCTSVMLEGSWDARAWLRGLSMRMQCAIDRGSLRGNNFGISLSLTYTGKI